MKKDRLTGVLGGRAAVGEAVAAGQELEEVRHHIGTVDQPFLIATRCGEDAPAAPLAGKASDSAGESYEEPSTGATETEAAEDIIGLVKEGCVRLGEDVAADTCSLDNVGAVDCIDGAGGAAD